jgi:hypothetical protein
MKFKKNVRGKQIEFFVEENSDMNVNVRVEIPPYGLHSRGELYTSAELNILVKEEIQGLTSLNNDGRFLAEKENYKNINLSFEKKQDKKTKLVVSKPKTKINNNIKNKVKTTSQSRKKTIR